MSVADHHGREPTLFVTETECAERLGFSVDSWRRLRRRYERLHLPPPDAISKRRYWPAVRAFFDRLHGLDARASIVPSQAEEEDLDALNTKDRRRPRA
ncbi:hypothetical protein [Labrys wisconsinensis]|uniref:Uncharacterized protein n=1 Tax=Labrys wisconsinensis TaxID=425677 RepID=A0ABU0JH15_9HYPH|nr:hypothetical protein [Labrys wisconsinensis]MDQ0472771.1 hypothetical protein [Labrys wisconsinensis]